MPTKSKDNVVCGPGKLYFIDFDGREIEVSVGEVVEEPKFAEDEMVVPFSFNQEPLEFTFTCKLSFRQRVKLFGFWPVFKSLFRRNKNGS